jgi:cyclohexa-1,5-dienecarbonyl-CoA hydratase
MEFKHILYDFADGAAVITINRPPLNILTLETMRELAAAYRRAEATPEVRLVVLRAAGSKAFAAGVDVKDHLPEVMDQLREAFEELMLTFLRGRRPSLAVVEGICSGGGFELALCCDMILASEGAVFSLPEIMLSLFPGLALPLLPRKLPRNRAFELITTGGEMSAQEAHSLGLVNWLALPDKLEEDLERVRRLYRAKSARALELTRYALLRAYDLPMEAGLRTVDDIYFGLMMQSKDAQEGINSFLEKRRPVWSHA